MCVGAVPQGAHGPGHCLREDERHRAAVVGALSAVLKPTIVNVGYRSTNYWVISAGASRLLVDLGWPGTMKTLRANLDRMGVPLSEIRYGLATHYHPDHAGLAQELKQAGVPLLVLDVQLPEVPRLTTLVKPRVCPRRERISIAFGFCCASLLGAVASSPLTAQSFAV